MKNRTFLTALCTIAASRVPFQHGVSDIALIASSIADAILEANLEFGDNTLSIEIDGTTITLDENQQ